MTPQLRNQIAIFHPQGFLDGNNAPAIIDEAEIKYVSKVKARGAMICFDKIVFFNKNGIFYLVEKLQKIRKQQDIEVGIVSYNPNVFRQLVYFFKGQPEIHLFQSMKIMDLLMDGKREEKDKIIVFNHNSEQRGHILMRLKEKGIEDAVLAKSDEELKEKREQNEFKFVIDSTFLTTFSKKVPYYTKENAVIYELIGYIDVGIKESFDYQYHTHSLATGFKIFIFDCKQVNSLNTHAVNFFNRLAVDGAEYGAVICITGLDPRKVSEKLIEELEAGGIIFEESIETALKNEDINGEDGGAIVQENLKTISKKVVKEVPVFIDATVSSIELMTGSAAKKEGANIGAFEVDNDTEYIIASVGFFGDLEGILFLFFPREIAKKACTLLLGEESKDLSDELDALSELINIITGKVKTVLINQKEIAIQNTLPRTFSKLENAKKLIGSRKGVLVKMSFDKEPFYFFLTR